MMAGVLFATLSTSHAQDGGKPGEGGPPATKRPFCVLQVASIDRVEKAAEYISRFFQDKAALEQKYKKWLDEWNEPDGADRNRPIGLMVFLGDTISDEPWFVLSFPVTDPGLFLKGLGKDNPDLPPPAKVPGKPGVWEIPALIPGITHAIEVGDSLMLCDAKVLDKPYTTFASFDDASRDDAKQFDFSLSFRLSEVPPGIRSVLGVAIRAGMAQATDQIGKDNFEQREGSTPELDKLLKSALRVMMNGYAGALEKLFADGTNITLGMRLDPELELMEVSLPWLVAPNSTAAKMIDGWRVQEGRLANMLSGIDARKTGSYSYTGVRMGKTLLPLGGILSKAMEEGVKARIEDPEQQKSLIKSIKPLQDFVRGVFSGKPIESYSEMITQAATPENQQAYAQFEGIALIAFPARKNFAVDLPPLLEKLTELKVEDRQLVEKVTLNVSEFNGLPIHRIEVLVKEEDPAKALEEIPGFPKIKLNEAEENKAEEKKTEEKKAGDEEQAEPAKLVSKSIHVWISDDLVWYSTLPLEASKARIAKIVAKTQEPADPLSARTKIPFYISSVNLKDLSNTLLKPLMPTDLPPVDPAVGALQSSLRPLDNGVVLTYRAEQAWIRLMAIGIEKGLLAADVEEQDEEEAK
jgi:hypothetical protein